MKKLTLILFILLNTINLYSQEDAIIDLRLLGQIEEEVDKYYYYKDINNDLDKFLGTWLYQDATKELIVTFYLKLHDDAGGDFKDRIYAKFKYTDNGTVIYNTLNDVSEASEYIIFGSSISLSGKEISLAYNEPTDIPYESNSQYKSLNLKYITCSELGCSPQLKWNIFYVRPDENAIWPFKIPSDLVLTKQ